MQRPVPTRSDPRRGAHLRPPRARAGAADARRIGPSGRHRHARLPLRWRAACASPPHTATSVDGAATRRRSTPSSTPDTATTTIALDAATGETVTITKYVAYHAAGQIDDASDRAGRRRARRPRCGSTLDDASPAGWDALAAEQSAWLDQFWARTDIAVEGDDAAQQAIRWNLFQMAQASANVGERGIAAKAVTAGGYDGHYFWDTEVYVIPMLAYTNPDAARDLLRFRHRDASDGTPAGDRDVAARRAVPVAHDQRRGGVGLLPGRHRPVPHRRRRRLRDRPLRHRHRRHRVPPRRGRRDAGRDRPAVRRPRLLRPARAARVPHPRRHRAGRVHRRRRRQRVHQRDGALHAAVRRQHREHARLAPPRRPRTGSSTATGLADDEVAGVDARRRRDVRALRRRARHQSRRTTRSSGTSRGTGRAHPPTSIRCCSTSTRS